MDYMQIAIEQANIAARKGEVPVGAVVVQLKNGKRKEDRIIAKAHNLREHKQNALAHAETLAIARACKKLRSWRLDDCVMFVTLQPCLMCAGAILNSRIRTVVLGALATDKAGTAIDGLDIYANNNLNWETEVEKDLREECSLLLKKFFAEKR